MCSNRSEPSRPYPTHIGPLTCVDDLHRPPCLSMVKRGSTDALNVEQRTACSSALEQVVPVEAVAAPLVWLGRALYQILKANSHLQGCDCEADAYCLGCAEDPFSYPRQSSSGS